MNRADFLKTLSVGTGLLLGGAPPIPAGEKPRRRDLEEQDAQAPYNFLDVGKGELSQVYVRKIHLSKLPARTTYVKHHIKDLDKVVDVKGVQVCEGVFSALQDVTVRTTQNNLILQVPEGIADREALMIVYYKKKRLSRGRK